MLSLVREVERLRAQVELLGTQLQHAVTAEIAKELALEFGLEDAETTATPSESGSFPALCPERWGDEIGCDQPLRPAAEHGCGEAAGHPHRWHACRWCGAMAIEDTVAGELS
jgi:hypothetical protein